VIVRVMMMGVGMSVHVVRAAGEASLYIEALRCATQIDYFP
jgi:hypothetical protein